MLYITGQHALNLPCELLTCGDWHRSALQWERPMMRESGDSVFGTYGIDSGVTIPEHSEKYNAANHIRALLDLLELGLFPLAQGMNKDYICNDEYTEELFSQVVKLRGVEHWEQVDAFMGKEYCMTWVNYKKKLRI